MILIKIYASSVNDIDDYREVGKCQNHLKFISNSDSSNHVSDNTTSSSELCISFFSLKPHSEFDCILILFTLSLVHFEWNVFKGFLEGTKRTFNFNLSGLNSHSNTFWDLDLLFSHDILHW